MTEEVVELACLCGEVFRGRVGAPIASNIRYAWGKVHRGPGHGPTDPETALKARLDQEDALLSELDGPEAALTVKLLAALRGVGVRRPERVAGVPPPTGPAPRG